MDKGATKNYCLNCDKPLVIRFTERKGGFFAKKNLSKEDMNETLKNISEGEITVNTDEYSIYEDLNELENVKEHRFVYHSKEYAKECWFHMIIIFLMT